MGFPLSSPRRFGPARAARRQLVIVASVMLLHLAALWALQTGLLQRVVEVLVPVQVSSEFIEPPRPRSEPPRPVPKSPAPVTQATPRKVESALPPPMPLASVDPTPAANAPAGVLAAPASLAPIAAPVAAMPAPVAPSQSPVELPSSDADYLQNPKPAYPAMSKRLGEQGKVVLRVLISVDGAAQQAEIRQSSGYQRLDQAALATAQRWRYLPGKRGGVPEAMWFSVPINFVLE